MKRLTEYYKLYRELPIFEALLSSLEELAEKDILTMELVPVVVHQYDTVVFNLLRLCRNEITFTANLLTFRTLPDTQWFELANVTINQTPSRASRRRAKSLCKVERLKLWCMDSLSENGGKMIVEQASNPYVLEVEEIKKVKKKSKFNFEKDLKKEKTFHTFDPRMHIRELSRASDTKTAGALGPMPYNEKLRRGGRERALEIAESQLSKIEVLKGRYRMCAREYPHRCVEDRLLGKSRDSKMVSGKIIYKRNYFTNILTQDRFLAEMAVKAGGCLALTAHNIHVAPIRKPRVDIMRECYRTRRKCNIEMSTFDSRQSFSMINLEGKKPTMSTCSSSDSDICEKKVNSDVEGEEEKPLIKIGPKSRMKLKSTEPVTPDSNHSSSCNEDFSWKKSKQFNDRKKDEIKNEALVNGISKSLDKDKDDSWDSLIKEITEGIERQEFPVKEESESRQNSFELRTNRIKKVKDDFKKFNDGEEENSSISFDLDI